MNKDNEEEVRLRYCEERNGGRKILGGELALFYWSSFGSQIPTPDTASLKL